MKQKTFHLRNLHLFCYQTQLLGLKCVHLVVCCVGWVHSFWVHFLWESLGCWNVVLARKVYVCIIIVHGRLCSGDNRSGINSVTPHKCACRVQRVKAHYVCTFVSKCYSSFNNTTGTLLWLNAETLEAAPTPCFGTLAYGAPTMGVPLWDYGICWNLQRMYFVSYFVKLQTT